MITYEMLKQIIDKLSSGVIISDADGNFLLWNKKAESIIGMDIKNPSLANWTEYYKVTKKDGTQLKVEEIPIIKALAGITTSNEVVLVKNIKIPDGVFLSVDSFPLETADGKKTGAVIFYNISEKIRMEELFDDIARRFEHLKSLLQVTINTEDLSKS